MLLDLNQNQLISNRIYLCHFYPHPLFLFKKMGQTFLARMRRIIKVLVSQIFKSSHDSFFEFQINSIGETDLFTTFYTRRISPKRQIEQDSRIQVEAVKYSEPTIYLESDQKLGIVIQGPVCTQQDFTSRVIARYLELYPEAIVIFSTWHGEENKLLEIDKFNLNSRFRLLLNSKPINPGISNINLQIESSRNGLKLAKELNCEFGIKTRSDQAFLNPNAVTYMHFELTEAKQKYVGNERIVAVSLDTFLFRPYGVSDMFHFGRIETLLNFWDMELDSRKPESFSEMNATTLREFSKLTLTECYLNSNYLKKMNFIPDFSLRQSLEFIIDYFVIVDQQTIDLIWNKNTYKEFRYKSDVYPSKFQGIENWEWRAMQTNLDSFLRFEFLLDYPNDF